jgi:hypothetical protein
MTAPVRVAGALVLVLVAGTGPAAALQTEVQRYHDLARNICQTGVTEQIRVAYEEARVAVEKAQYGGGRDNNFWGLKSPGKFWLECVQSPGNLR